MFSPGKRRSLVLALGLVVGGPGTSLGQLAPSYGGGFVELDRLLQRLGESRRVLVIGAHPDDEDTALLALMARGYGAEAAYLSLSRGEGGQNLIGTELGPGLGLLRSRELLAARSVDGARQFFTRAYDFGFTRSIDETNGLWHPDSVLKDVVRVVRRFRPHVIVSVFSGTPRDGHGQHQAAGIAAGEAFAAAGDDSRFPELASEEGLSPWSPLKLYRSARRNAPAASLTLATGSLDPRQGRSYHQIAMASRSRHRSQDMGSVQPIGPRTTRVLLEQDGVSGDPDAGGSSDFFAGISPEGEWVQFARQTRAAIDPADLASVTRRLVERLSRTVSAKRVLLERAVAVSAGLVTDAVVDDDGLVPGQTTRVTLSLYNSGPFDVSVDRASVTGPAGWSVRGGAPIGRVPPGTMATAEFEITVPRNESPTQPYFLERPRQGAMYDWSGTVASLRGTPFQPPALAAQFVVSLLGQQVRLTREATYRARNQATGEVRREVRVVPEVDVVLAPATAVWPAGADQERDFTVVLTHNGVGPYAGEVGLVIDGWPAPPVQRFAFERTGESSRFVFSVQRPGGVQQARVRVRAVATGDDRRELGRGVSVVTYPHVRATAWVQDALSDVTVAPMALPPVSRVGYVRGAADRVPEALIQIGVPVEVLRGDQLATADLSEYDVIIIGSRAYETDTMLTAHNTRILEYAREGGSLVVQYQQYQFVGGGYAAHPLQIGRPHDRVTDETAPVRILEPGSPAFTTPNRIEVSDWDDWPQERGLYFAQTWDDAYRPLLETNDPGRPPLQGGLLVARYGAGTYVYTGLSFFRALPAGNVGAFRLFLNLIGLRTQHVP